MPESRTWNTASRPLTSTLSPILPPSPVYFAGIIQYVGKHLGESGPVSFDPDWIRRQLDFEGLALRLDQRPARLDGVLDNSGDIDRLHEELNLAPRNPGDIEQVVDQGEPSGRLAGRSLHLPSRHPRRSNPTSGGSGPNSGSKARGLRSLQVPAWRGIRFFRRSSSWMSRCLRVVEPQSRHGRRGLAPG